MFCAANVASILLTAFATLIELGMSTLDAFAMPLPLITVEMDVSLILLCENSSISVAMVPEHDLDRSVFCDAGGFE